jgi:hypothetical protein
MNTSFIPYDIRSKQWNMERKIKKQLFDPDFDFLGMYTRETLREVMIALFPYESMVNKSGRAFCGMTKKRMYKHLLGYAVLKEWIVLPYYYE